MDLVEQRDDSELAKLRKPESASKILIRLNNLVLAVCEGVNAKVEEDKSLNHATMTWGKVPAKYKEFAVPLLIDMAKKSFIPLDRSEENWAPKLLLTRRYHNKFNKKKGKETAKESAQSSSDDHQSNVENEVQDRTSPSPVIESSSMTRRWGRIEDLDERHSNEEGRKKRRLVSKRERK
ncbi:unnamed protein product [Rhizopus stolonifer]